MFNVPRQRSWMGHKNDLAHSHVCVCASVCAFVILLGVSLHLQKKPDQSELKFDIVNSNMGFCLVE